MSLLFVVQIKTTPEFLPVLNELVAAEGVNSASWRNPDTGEAYVRVYAESAENAQAFEESFRRRLTQDWHDLFPEESAKLAISSQVIKQEDWSETWKRHFHVFRASRRLVVKPSWEQYATEKNDVVLELDPGMCFGTGYHGTTLACLRFLDDLQAQRGAVSLLDAGCGSGILSLAAAKLGYHPVTAFDNDPEAVAVSKQNLNRNNITSVNLSVAELSKFKVKEPFQVVVANILAHILQLNVEALAKLTAQGGALILSGILTEQYDDVLRAYQTAGFTEEQRLTLDEWTSGRFLKK